MFLREADILVVDDFIDRIIDDRRLVTLMQPIVSLKEKRVVGYEALSRGMNPDTDQLIEPLDLFDAARRGGRLLDLDRACRQCAFERWVYNPLHDDRILYVNFDTSILSGTIPDTGWMAKIVESLGIDPHMVAVEIVESRAPQNDTLFKFVRLCREAGFLVVLDDFGTAYSNLDRMMHVRPDIIKIDRSLISGVNSDYYKQSIVGSIIDLAGKIGALTLAEGVESLDDIITCYELGADLFQGYYFAKPAEDTDDAVPGNIIHLASQALSQYLELNLAERILVQKSYDTVANRVIEQLTGITPRYFNKFLQRQVAIYPQVECAYILSSLGRQVSETVLTSATDTRPSNPLFRPASRGTDHSLKSYYSSLRGLSLTRYFTSTYISMASGNLCRTFAATFTGGDGITCILCIDFRV